MLLSSPSSVLFLEPPQIIFKLLGPVKQIETKPNVILLYIHFLGWSLHFTFSFYPKRVQQLSKHLWQLYHLPKLCYALGIIGCWNYALILRSIWTLGEFFGKEENSKWWRKWQRFFAWPNFRQALEPSLRPICYLLVKSSSNKKPTESVYPELTLP